MNLLLDTESIRMINLFETITGVSVKDCLVFEPTNTVYFIIEEGKTPMAVGRNGFKVKKIQSYLDRNIKIVEYSQDVKKFVKNLIPEAKEIVVEGEKVIVSVDKVLRSRVIGREGRRLNFIKQILKRNTNIKELVVK